MKLFVIWADKGLETVNLIQKLKDNSREAVYWLGYDDSEMHRLPGVIFHSYRDAILAKPAKGVDDSEFSPPDEALIRKLAKAESLFLSMSNRFFYKDKSVSERRHLYYRMLRYWLGAIKKYQPEAIIFSDVPHYMYDFALYNLARELGIKTLTFLDTRIPGRLLYFNDFKEGSLTLKKELEKNRGKDFTVSDLADDVRNYYEKYSDRNLSILPPNIRFQKSRYSFFYRLLSPKTTKSIKDGTFFRKVFVYFFGLWKKISFSFLKDKAVIFSYRFRNNLEKEYRRAQSAADFSKKFVYVPLHVQPECSTSPQGDAFVDQLLMLEILSASLPEGWVIYAKEHPIQWLRFGPGFCGDKYAGFYGKMADISKVNILPMETDSYRLIKESQAVAVISGAAGWEALLRNKPAIIFGYPWYKDCPEALKVNDADSCRAALEKIAGGLTVSRRQIINYLKSLENSSIRAYIAPSAGNESGISQKESMRNIAAKLLEELKMN